MAALILVAALMAGCGSSGNNGNGGAGTAASGQGGAPAELSPRSVSAADLEVGEGVDFCDEFPEPVVEPWRARSGSPLGVLPGEHVLGSEDALVTLVVYNDLAAEASSDLVASLIALSEQSENARVVYRHFVQDGIGLLAAQAVEAAAAQDGDEGFWALAALLAERRTEWDNLSEGSFIDVVTGYADEVGLDGEQIAEELEAGQYSASVSTMTSSGVALNIPQAPAMYVNDTFVQTPPRTLEDLSMITQIMVLRVKYPEAPSMVIDPDKEYVAWIETSKGTIALDLFADLAPETVNNFAYLACMGYYDNVTFHRVLEEFMAQAGDPTGTGMGGPGYTIHDEFDNSSLIFDREGLLSMAHTRQPDSAGAQFFITLGPAAHLNGSFTIFGEVVEGMQVVQSLKLRDPETAGPLDVGDTIETVIVRQAP